MGDSTSFGLGIAEQYKPSADYGKWFERDYRAQAAAGAKKKQDEDNALRKWYDSIKIDHNVIDPYYEPEAKRIQARFLDAIPEAQAKYPTTWQNVLGRQQQDAEDQLSELGALSRSLKQNRTVPKEQLTDPQQKYLNHINTQTVDDYDAFRSQNPDDPMGTISYGERGRANFGEILPKKPKMQEDAADLLNKINQSNMVTMIDLKQRFPGNHFGWMSASSLPETIDDAKSAEARILKETGQPVHLVSKEEALTQKYMGDPATQAWFRESNRKKYGEDKTIDWKDAYGTHDRIAKDYYEAMKGYGGQSFKAHMAAVPRPRESEETKISGNSYTAGNYQYDYFKHDDGVVETTVKKTKGGEVEPNTYTDFEGNNFKGTFAGQKFDPKEGVDKIKTYVYREFKNETDHPIRIDKTTGKQIPDGQPANSFDVYMVPMKSSRIEKVEVPPTNENLGKVKYGGVGFWDIHNAMEGKTGTVNAGGKQNTITKSSSSSSTSATIPQLKDNQVIGVVNGVKYIFDKNTKQNLGKYEEAAPVKTGTKKKAVKQNFSAEDFKNMK